MIRGGSVAKIDDIQPPSYIKASYRLALLDLHDPRTVEQTCASPQIPPFNLLPAQTASENQGFVSTRIHRHDKALMLVKANKPQP